MNLLDIYSGILLSQMFFRMLAGLSEMLIMHELFSYG